MGAVYEVRIVHKKTGEVVKSMGPLPLWTAERVEAGANINLNHDDYKVVTVRLPLPNKT